MELYSFDTSAFIETWHRLLPPTTFVSFWRRLEDLIESRIVQAVDEVKVEIDRRDDAVKAWAAGTGTAKSESRRVSALRGLWGGI